MKEGLGMFRFEKLRKRYLFAIGLTAFLLTTNQAVIQYYLRAKKLDASTVNVAGRQRMLSQRIGLLAGDVLLGGDPAELHRVFEEMKESNLALQEGNVQAGVQRFDNEQVQSMLKVLEYRLSVIEVEVDRLVTSGRYRSGAFREQQELFLPMMNDVVGIIEKEAEDKLQAILLLEIILFVLSITLLILEIRYFFRPMLEEAAGITTKNRKAYELMRRMAFEYAHHIRAPLANMLGIIDLMKGKGEDELIDLLEASAQELDAHVQESVGELNNLDREVSRTMGD